MAAENQEPEQAAPATPQLNQEALAAKLALDVSGDLPVFSGASLLKSLGGWAGIVESSVPPTVFVIIYSLTQQAIWAVSVSAALSVISIIRQLIIKRPISQAISGLALTGLSAWLALKNGNSAKDYFLPGFYTNAGYGAAMLISVLVRWPLIGVIIGLFKGWGFSWRQEKALMQRFTLVTAMWAGLFAFRLAVELPLYFANNVEALGLVKLVLGTPTYALFIWFTWLASRSVILAKP